MYRPDHNQRRTCLVVCSEALGRRERRAGIFCGRSGLAADDDLQGCAVLVSLKLAALCWALICSSRLGALYLLLQQLLLALLTLLERK